MRGSDIQRSCCFLWQEEGAPGSTWCSTHAEDIFSRVHTEAPPSLLKLLEDASQAGHVSQGGVGLLISAFSLA